MNNAAKGLRRAISSIDMHVIEPAINDVFTNEMLYNPDESIKGDCIVIPRGAAAILIRESMQQRRLQYLTIISNPTIAQALGSKYMVNTLREVAQAMELPVDEVVPSADEFDKQQAAMAEQQQMGAQAEQEAEFAKEAKLLELEHQFDMQKEAVIGARETEQQKTKMLSDMIGQAVSSALAAQQEKGKGDKKKLKFNYDDAGNLIGGEEESEE
jgi:glutamyl/glutaminyl-tRNA synthetase